MSAEQPPADDVEFHRHRELLIFEHGFRRLAMELDAAVLIGPRRCPSDLLADEAVFRPKPKMRQFPPVEDTGEFTAKLLVLSEGHLQHSVLHSEGLAVVIVAL